MLNSVSGTCLHIEAERPLYSPSTPSVFRIRTTSVVAFTFSSCWVWRCTLIKHVLVNVQLVSITKIMCSVILTLALSNYPLNNNKQYINRTLQVKMISLWKSSLSFKAIKIASTKKYFVCMHLNSVIYYDKK